MTMLPVMQVMPSSVITVGAPRSGKQGPAVLRLTTSFSVPGWLPLQVFRTEPTVAIFFPPNLVRIGASAIPWAEVPMRGYGTGMGLGAAGVVHTLTAQPTHWCPDPSVTAFILQAVTDPML